MRHELKYEDLYFSIHSWFQACRAFKRLSGESSITDKIKSCPQLLTPCCVKREFGKRCKPWMYSMSWESCGKAGFLVSIWNTISPRDHISAAHWLVDLELWLVEWVANPRSSGAMNCGVPFTVDGIPKLSSIRFEIPKSAILTHQVSGGQDLIRMFYMLMFSLDAIIL